jgi:hypothetical protein
MPAALPVGSNGQAWSQALDNVSGTLQTLALKKAEADDSRQLIEAEGEMQRHELEFQQFQQTHVNQDDWLPKWQERQTEMQKYIDGLKLTDNARLRLTSSFGRWSDGHAIAIQGEAFKQSVGRSLQAIETRAGQAADNRDRAGIDSALSFAVEGSMTPEQKEAARVRFYKRADAADLKAENDAANAFLMQDQPDLHGAIAVFDGSKLMSENEKAIAKAKATSFYNQKIETQKNKASADFYSELNYEAAKGNYTTAAMVEEHVRNGSLTHEDATPLLEGIRRREAGLPANPVKFNDFINNRVLKYDPTKDTTGAEFEKIQREAAAMGIDQFQAQRLTSNIQAVVESNKSPAGRATSHVKSYGLDRVNDLMKAGAFGKFESSRLTPELAAILSNQGELERFGLTEDQAKSVADLKGEEKLSLFQSFAKSRYNKDAPLTTEKGVKQFNDIPADKVRLLNSAMEPGLTIDPALASEAAGKAAQIQDQFEAEFKRFTDENKRPPNNKEVMKMVDGMTREFRAGASLNWDAFEAPVEKPQASNDPVRYRVEPDGSFVGTASSYGYEGDADNGFNSVGFKRGEQPWYGEHPTVALAPATAESLGVVLPRRNKDGWDTSNSLVEIEFNGKKVKAIFDETGMYINPKSKNKLVDLTPEASEALGVPIKENVTGIKVRKAS